uniref:Uncharacterized protein n=1 Tax=Hordeum vulgare subsp. vulgare TaxID=112509 RepID=A0A8I6YE41_HORVV
MPSMDVSAISDLFVETIAKALARAIEGLNDSTITDPQRRDILQAVCLMLPAGDIVPRIATVRPDLQKLISFSNEIQGAREGIDNHSQKQAEVVNGAETESGLLEDILKATSKKMFALKKQYEEEEKVVEDLGAQLKAASSAMQATEEAITQLELEQSAKQSEAKKLREKLLEVNAKGVQELRVLEEKVSLLGNEIASIIDNLKNWRALPN